MMKKIKEAFIPDYDSTYDAVAGLAAIAWGITQIEEEVGDSNLNVYVKQLDRICYQMDMYIEKNYPQGNDEDLVIEIQDGIAKALKKL